MTFLEAAGLEPKRTSVQKPWQNGIAERWIGSRRREILDHVIALNEEHLRRLLRDYVNYHEQDRLHDSLEKDAPNRRVVEQRPGTNATVISLPRLGGLHATPGAKRRSRFSKFLRNRSRTPPFGIGRDFLRHLSGDILRPVSVGMSNSLGSTPRGFPIHGTPDFRSPI
jgi:hypothetical protein